jgi:hypothetical protein
VRFGIEFDQVGRRAAYYLRREHPGEALPMSGADAADGSVKIAGATAVIEDPVQALVRYDWQPQDVDTVGRFFGYFIREKEGRTEHFPTEGPRLAIDIIDAGT